jgi:ribosomal protein S18 acetylase RimI-like enzyme
MIKIRRARQKDVEGIRYVCSEGYRDTYVKTHSKVYIEKTIEEFYNITRLTNEVSNPEGWNGWYVAVENEVVLGAGGGGVTGENIGEIYVLYLNPQRKGEGIGTLLLEAITNEQIQQGVKTQWVSVSKGNDKGIPFYEAKGFEYHSEQKTFASSSEDKYTSLRYVREINK